jgi:hypothetical protein
MNFLVNPLVIGWIVLALIVAALAMYRKMLTNQEDDIVHVSGESGTLTRQITLAHRLEKIDLWGKTLTIILVLYGLGLAGWLIYQGWVASVSLSN